MLVVPVAEKQQSVYTQQQVMQLTYHNYAHTKYLSRSGQTQVWITAYLTHPTLVIFISNDLVTSAVVILYI